jgi:hypothetical protein
MTGFRTYRSKSNALLFWAADKPSEQGALVFLLPGILQGLRAPLRPREFRNRWLPLGLRCFGNRALSKGNRVRTNWLSAIFSSQWPLARSTRAAFKFFAKASNHSADAGASRSLVTMRNTLPVSMITLISRTGTCSGLLRLLASRAGR